MNICGEEDRGRTGRICGRSRLSRRWWRAPSWPCGETKHSLIFFSGGKARRVKKASHPGPAQVRPPKSRTKKRHLAHWTNDEEGEPSENTGAPIRRVLHRLGTDAYLLNPWRVPRLLLGLYFLLFRSALASRFWVLPFVSRHVWFVKGTEIAYERFVCFYNDAQEHLTNKKKMSWRIASNNGNASFFPFHCLTGLTYCYDDNAECFNAPCLEHAISYKEGKTHF
jgi:hypothetical protein